MKIAYPASACNALLRLILVSVVALSLSGCEKAGDAFFEARCSFSLEPTTVDVEVVPVEFSVDSSKSVAQITALYPPEYPGAVLGITKANLRKELSFDNAGMEQRGSGRLCTRPHVKVLLSFTPMQVLIASDFPTNSCKFNEIYTHEMRHVNAYTDYLPKVAADVKKQLESALGPDVHYFKDKAEAHATLETLLNSMWMPYLTAKMELVEQEQAQIDTFEEYERLSKVCRN